jgi:fructose-specific PTS system IIA-like component
MSNEFQFTCPLPNGLHARPASHLADVAKKFSSNCLLTNLRNNSAADMKSVLSLIAAGVRMNDQCSVKITGPDEQAAAAALRNFIANDLSAHDVPLPDVYKDATTPQLPRALRSEQVQAMFGRPASRGIAFGKLVVVDAFDWTPEHAARTGTPAQEEEQIHRALAEVRARIQAKLLEHLSATESGILRAHLAMLDDEALTAKMLEQVAQGKSAAEAIMEAGRFFANILRHSENPYMQERAADIQGLCLDLLSSISENKPTHTITLTEPSIVVAENLLPQQLLALDRNLLRGLVLESAGSTSHTVLLARSLGVPVLVGVIPSDPISWVPSDRRGEREPYDLEKSPTANAATRNRPKTPAILDANRGFLILNPTQSAQAFYQHQLQTQEKRKASLSRQIDAQSPMHISTNIASAAEAEAAFRSGADGVGVFRTEMLFLSHPHALSEEEQFAIYSQAARAAGNKPVVIRTLDIGGDKPLPFLKLPAEDNPFLGYRGARIYPEHQELLQTQLRAILRASVQGHVDLLVPMISNVEEVLWFKEQVAQAQKDLEAHQIPFNHSIKLGTMIEVPSAVFILDQLCPEVDFLSVGTNDLSQYFFATDRGNARVAGLAKVRHPAFLRLLNQIADAGRRHKKPVTVCGDMAADPRNLPLLLGLGSDEISVPVSDIAVLKERMARLSLIDRQRLLSEALSCGNAEDVERLLDREPASRRALLDREFLLFRDQVENKEEAIREIVDTLYIAGRTDDPDRLEDALWIREAAYSTSMVPGFSVPHCKSDSVNAPSLAVLKLRKPVSWGTGNDNPVQMVILLAARQSDAATAHLQVFSRLARNLMDEDFRNRLLKAANQDDLMSVLSDLTT